MNETAKRDRRDEKEEIRYHVIFYGQVQGVGFRYRAYYAAYQLGLTGWVRNCWDETVEMEVRILLIISVIVSSSPCTSISTVSSQQFLTQPVSPSW